jgi:hypothetical protein
MEDETKYQTEDKCLIEVYGELKIFQKEQYDIWHMTYKGEPKTVMGRTIKFHSLTLEEAISAVDTKQFDLLTITFKSK